MSLQDHPEKETLNFFHDIFNVVSKLESSPHSDKKISMYLALLRILTTAGQESYPYHVEKVDSNDTLYGSDAQFLEAVCNLCVLINEELLSYLKILGDQKLFKRQSKAALEYFYSVVTLGDSQKMSKLAFNLWRLSLKDVDDVKPLKKCLEFVRHKATINQDKYLEDLANKMANFLD
jgi:LOC100101331 protein (fragment)